MSRLAPVPRSQSRASLAASDTTYHSFCDAELHEPPMACDSGKDAEPLPSGYGMHRQDSGYESMTSRSSQASYRRRSSASAASSGPRPRARPSMRTAPGSGPVAKVPRDTVQLSRPIIHGQPPQRQEHTAYFHFPHFPSLEHSPPTAASMSDSNLVSDRSIYATDPRHNDGTSSLRSETPTYPFPPQTTHYWTSDRTRRLEYAAIDAASRGVRGWVIRHMVPDCFIPKDRRRIRFEDDRGSVVRYRLELEGDDIQRSGQAKSIKRRKGWWFSANAS